MPTHAAPPDLAATECALAGRPDDPALLTAHAIALEAHGRRDAAIAVFRRASEIDPRSASLAYNLGRVLSHHGDNAASIDALERALRLDPQHRAARASLAGVLRRVGRVDAAIAHYRELLARDPADSKVWSALAGLNRACFDECDIARMRALERDTSLDLEAQVRIGFALGKACESRGLFAEAHAAYVRANVLMRTRVRWNPAAFSAEADKLLAAFARPPAAEQPQLGSGMIFIVSLPRSGSTLIEQILASHRDVDAGEERPDLFAVIAEESRRRQQPVARWAAQATAQEWRRLGEAYLARAARWRHGKACATDKMPANWLWLGAALAMLPGARVIDCRRDPLETAWSCFTYLFPAGTQDFSFDFASIAAYTSDHARSMQRWHALYPQRLRTQSYEALVAHPEAQTRELLAFCGLDFDPACLRFHETERGVRTPSAAQVREPLRSDTARAAKYAALLDPLREALGLAPFQAR